MIPSKLELKNFICYPDAVQTVSFDNYSMICLSGKNGNGKSALLDAMTWALWGHARKISGVAKADDGLLRLGQTRMMVSLEFTLGTARYRVRREYAKTYGKPYAALDFEVFNQDTQLFISLTDKTIRATQAKIEQCIGLTFDTFINSAFLKQGQSNEFSKKTAKERKQILTNILGLEKYTKLQQLALETVRKQQEEKRMLLKLMEQRSSDLLQEPRIKADFEEQKKRLQEVQLQINDLDKQRIELEQQKRVYEEKQRQYDLLLQEHELLLDKKNDAHKRMMVLVQQWKTTHYQSIHLPDVVKLQHQREELTEKERSALHYQKTILTLQEKILAMREQAQKKITEKTVTIEKELHISSLELSALQVKIAGIKEEMRKKAELIKVGNQLVSRLQTDCAGASKLAERKTVLEQERERSKALFDRRKTFHQLWVQQGNRTAALLKELQQKSHAINEVEKPACPLCLQFLPHERKQALVGHFNRDGNFLVHQITRFKKILARLKTMLIDQHKAIELLQAEISVCEQHELKKKELEQQIQLRTEEVTRLTNEQEELALRYAQEEKTFVSVQLHHQSLLQKHAQIEQDEVVVVLRKDLAALEHERAMMIKNGQQFAQLAEDIKAVDLLLEQSKHVRDNLVRQQERRTYIVHYVDQLKQCKKQQQLLSDQIQKLKNAILHNQQTEASLVRIQQQRELIMQDKEKILQLLGNYESSLQRLVLVKEEQDKSIESQKTIDKEIELYQHLAQMFSKDGIQALLIEEVIPEIETEANAILAKLTNNQSQIFVESLRDLKSGGVKETLDIKISDAVGIRPYEMFSGGEAFRIDFALRIALSKLLARRSGAALQTLIIDEGFGSQDEDGLARLMDAILAIQHDFSKVIIVSHLAEFKDNFPVHFVVEKGVNGSMIHVEERG